MPPTGGQTETPMSNSLQLNTQQLSQIVQKIKNNPSSEGHHQILQMLKSNPQIMAAIIKQRQQSQNSGAGVAALNQGNGPPPSQQVMQQGGHMQHMINQQQQPQQNQVVMPNQPGGPHNRMPAAMQNAMMVQGGSQIQQQVPVSIHDLVRNKNIFPNFLSIRYKIINVISKCRCVKCKCRTTQPRPIHKRHELLRWAVFKVVVVADLRPINMQCNKASNRINHRWVVWAE